MNKMINKKGILVAFLIYTLVPIGLKIVSFDEENVIIVAIGVGLYLSALLSGTTALWISLDIPSPLSFLHRNDNEIIERLDKIKKKINN